MRFALRRSPAMCIGWTLAGLMLIARIPGAAAIAEDAAAAARRAQVTALWRTPAGVVKLVLRWPADDDALVQRLADLCWADVDADASGQLSAAEIEALSDVRLLRRLGLVDPRRGSMSLPKVDLPAPATRGQFQRWLHAWVIADAVRERGAAGGSLAGTPAGGRIANGREISDRRFEEWLDADQDSAFSREELTNAWEQSQTVDWNTNELVERDELLSLSAGSASPRSMGRNRARGSSRERSPSAASSQSSATNPPAIEPLTGRWMARTAAAPQIPSEKSRATNAADGTEALTIGVVSVDWADAATLAETGDTAGPAAGGEGAVDSPAADWRPVVSSQFSDPDVRLSHMIANTRLVRLQLAGETLRIALNIAGRDGEIEDWPAMFRQQDLDQNEYLTRAEVEQNSLFLRLLSILDRDQNSQLEFAEFLPWSQRATLMSRLSWSVKTVTAEQSLWQTLDTNLDGRLSHRELCPAAAAWARLDRDGSERLELAELVAAAELLIEQPRWSPRGMQGPPETIEPNRGEPPLTAETAGTPSWFLGMDRNRDGDLSRREFLGSNVRFTELDRDGDGVISREEARAASGL